MKVLLLSCNTGGGHNATARAIRAYFEKMGDTCRTVNALTYLPRATAELITHGHDFAYRHAPLLYGAGYRYEEKHPSPLMYQQNVQGAGLLWNDLRAHGDELVICVHIFPAMMMTELRRSYGCRLPCYFVATDYTCSPGVGELEADGFCIPHADLKGEFASAGIPPEKIYATGIPVDEGFYHHTAKKSARRALELPEEGHVYLLSCGSMGAGPIRPIALFMERQLGENDRLVVICGSNKKLYRDLSFFFSQSRRVRVLGFTDKMRPYMRACDLLISKAGGLTTTEAVAAGVPLLYLNAVPGCESRNIAFMNARGYALAARDDLHFLPLLRDCMENPEPLSIMVKTRAGAFPPHPAQAIYELSHT